jgi:arylsulfatase
MTRRATALILLLLCVPSNGLAAPEPASRPNVILITLDTTRADHLGAYGYDLKTSPRLDRLASHSVVFDRVTAPGTWTLTSHASLMTGKLPTAHGANFDAKGWMVLSSAIDGPYDNYRVRPLGNDQLTLAELLREAGYLTGAVVAGPWLKRQFGLAQGFVFYDDEGISSLNGRRAADVTDRALAWLDRGGKGPRFLFLNYFDPHGPLLQPKARVARFLRPGNLLLREPFASRAREFARYDAEISYMDMHIGRLFEGLKQRGLYDDSWIIVTADHGELFGERGATGHGGAPPYREVTRVPLIVKKPGMSSGSRSDQPMQLIDVAPMLLAGLSLGALQGVQGEAVPDVNRPIVTEAQTVGAYGDAGDWLAFEDGGKKLIWHSSGNHQLFDLVADPEEATSLASQQPEIVESLTKRLLAYLEGLPKPTEKGETIRIDAETEQALRSLGYLR